MFENDIKKVRMRSITPIAYEFWKNRYKPAMDELKRKISATPMTIGIWIPRLAGTVRLQVYEIVNDLKNINITAKLWFSDSQKDDKAAAMKGLELLCQGIENQSSTNTEDDDKEKSENEIQIPEIVFGILLGKTFELELFSNISPDAASKLFIFFNSSIENNYTEQIPDFHFKDIYPRSMPIEYPADFKSRSFIHLFLTCIDALRRSKYLQSLILDSDRPLTSKKSIFSFYEDFKYRIDTFQSSGHHYFISFVRFLSNPSPADLQLHLDVDVTIKSLCDYFKDNRFIEINNGEIELTYSGDKYFKMLGIESLPILENEKYKFKERWRTSLERAFYTRYELINNTNELSRLSAQFYFSLAKKLPISRICRYTINRFFFDWLTEEEKKFLAHPWTEKLFQIWRENIAGIKRVWRSGARDRTAFLEYMFHKFTIRHNPKKADLYVNFKNLAFNHTMLRPNNICHFYMIFSFEVRPIKKMIRQYFDLAAITGQYDLLFRRFYPYHIMLKLHARPGERTSFDMRNYLDWKPLTFKMDIKFSVPLTLDNVRTRQRDRFISIPIVKDDEAEAQKEAEISALKKQIENLNRSLFINYDFGPDGKIYTSDEKNPREIENFMGKRLSFIQKSDELDLLKAIPRPGSQSGMVVRFNLLDPIAVLINGINRNRDLYLDEMRYLSKCLSLIEKRNITELDSIIDEVFESPKPKGLSEETYDLLNAFEKIEKTEKSDDEAWAYLTSRFIHGKYHALLHTICHRLSDDGFEVLFSLFPLLTGKELKIEEKKETKETPLASFTENQIPLIENLKRELSDLLKDVFTRCIDISGATKRIQSEAKLALMIVEQCLNVKSNWDEFEKKLRLHLQKHYQIHFHFLKEHLGDSELVRNIHKIDVETHEMIETDLAEIIRLTRVFQKRLFSRANNNRLLCFIDPGSVEVQMGEFKYGGDAIQSELEYIHKKENKQRELAEKQQAHDAEIREKAMERHAAKEKSKIEREKEAGLINKEKAIREMRLNDEKEKEEARINKEKTIREMRLKDEEDRVRAEEKKEEQIANSRMNISQYKVKQIAGETQYLAAEALKQGDMKTYAVLSLLEAHQGRNGTGGMKGVENLLEESPNLLLTIAPEILEARNVQKLKETLLNNLDTVLDKLDPITLSTLFSKDYDELIRSDHYKSILNVMSDTLKHMGFRNRAVVEQVFEEPKKGKRKG